MHPAEQLVQIMNRIYENKMTTTSGGNLSLVDDKGNIWITPSGVDKGNLTPIDICCIKPDCTPAKTNRHKPSVEAPVHAMIYRRRPDLKAIVHAHPPSLVAFSLARKLPRLAADKIESVPYALPGSMALGEMIADRFAEGVNLVMMESHGAVAGGTDIFATFRAFEAFEIAAATEINASKIGAIRNFPKMDKSFVPKEILSFGHDIAYKLVDFAQRAYRQKLFGALHGVFSARLNKTEFLITPAHKDRFYLEARDMVLVRDGQAENLSFDAQIHSAIYDAHPKVTSIVGASPPHAMAFAVTDTVFDSRTIPESYMMLRHVQRVPWDVRPIEVAASISDSTPVLILEGRQILATGDSIVKAFDRLEVAEATACSIIAAKSIGEIKHISAQEVRDIDDKFGLCVTHAR